MSLTMTGMGHEAPGRDTEVRRGEPGCRSSSVTAGVLGQVAQPLWFLTCRGVHNPCLLREEALGGHEGSEQRP